MLIKQLTFTRFIAALIIVLFHYGTLAFPFDKGMLNHFAQNGPFAVSFFFCLSGYILTQVYYQSDFVKINIKQYLSKRFARIYPVYFLALILTLALGFFINNSAPKGSSIILQLFALHAWVPGICLEINYPAWTISVEMFFYLSFPFLLNFFQKQTNFKLYIIAFTIWLISLITRIILVAFLNQSGEVWNQFVFFNPVFHLNAFIFGMVASIVSKRNFRSFNYAKYFNSFILITATFLIFIVNSTDNIFLPWGHSGLYSPLFVIIILGLHANRNFFIKTISLPIFMFLGEISFGIYILQHPVYLLFEYITKNMTIEPTTAFYLFLAVLILIASMVYLFIEKPARIWFNQNLKY